MSPRLAAASASNPLAAANVAMRPMATRQPNLPSERVPALN